MATAALRALPREVRASHGEEILGTLLDSSAAASHWEFAREILDLLRVGLRSRTARTASLGARRLLADGFYLGAIFVMTLDLSTLVSQRLGGIEDPLLSWASIGALGVILAITLIGAKRVGGIAALAWTAIRFPELVAHNATFGGIAPTLVPLVCFGALSMSPRATRLDLRRVAWLAGTVVLLAAYGQHGDGLITAIVSLAAVLLMVVAVLGIAIDPRLAIACALPATYVGLMVLGAPHLPAWLLSLGAPLTLSLAIVRVHRLRRGPAR
jgi:hypothetical protein